jgi:lipoprotein-releasing system ATP-binding protein
MNNPQPVLACYDLAKTYADGNATIHILKQITLEVVAGEWIAVVGHSGSGKSTFLHLLAGLDQPTRGSVFLNGKELQKISERERCFLRNRHLGFVYQFHYLLPEFSALENVGMPLLIRGDDPKLIRERATYLLEQVGLKDRLQHRPGQLSGGERQRVAIARALVTEPFCILADEPTGNLDPDNADRVLNLFYDLQQSHQTSVVMVTHDLSIANKAKRILRLEAGTID